MARRLLDVGVATLALLALSPLLAAAAIGIRLSSPGPVLYRAKRVGKDGRIFEMLKFRTMHVRKVSGDSAITARHDPRVFRFGSLLRTLKIDELPQLINILRGDMAIIGPRPEDPAIVEKWYTPEHRETLAVRPGLASPGSLFNYTHGEQWIGPENPEKDYVEKLLSLKLALDRVYVRKASIAYDISIALRTANAIVRIMAGKREFDLPPEAKEARDLISPPPAPGSKNPFA